MPHPLSTARLTLSPQQPGDAPWLAALFTARGDGHVGIEAAGRRIETMTRTLATTGIGALVMRPKDGSPPAGYGALVVGRSSLDQPEIAYEVLPAAQGRGYATEAAAALGPSRLGHRAHPAMAHHPLVERRLPAGGREARLHPSAHRHRRRARRAMAHPPPASGPGRQHVNQLPQYL